MVDKPESVILGMIDDKSPSRSLLLAVAQKQCQRPCSSKLYSQTAIKPALIIAFAIELTFCFAANAANGGQGGELMESKAFIAMTQKHLKVLAGKNAISCGDVQLKGNPNAANRCAQTAFPMSATNFGELILRSLLRLQ